MREGGGCLLPCWRENERDRCLTGLLMNGLGGGGRVLKDGAGNE